MGRHSIVQAGTEIHTKKTLYLLWATTKKTENKNKNNEVEFLGEFGTGTVRKH